MMPNVAQLLLPPTLMAVAAAVFSVSTALLERSGPIRLRHWAEEAGGRLRSLYDQAERLEAFRFLVNVISRVLLLAVLPLLWVSLEGMGAPRPAFLSLSLLAVWAFLVELLGRFLVRHDSELALSRLTVLYRVLLRVFWPLVVALGPFMPREKAEDRAEEDEASHGEIEAFIDVGRREGILEPEEGELLKGLVDFVDTQVRSVMTPRVDMVCAPADAGIRDLKNLFVSSGHSRIPLYQDSIDQIVGVLHIRDLLRVLSSDSKVALRQVAKPPHFVPETKPLSDLLKELQARHQELALVVDEYGGIEGLVTLEDLVEEIVGDIVDEHDESEPESVRLPDGSYRLDGGTHLEDLEEIFGVRFEEDRYETVGGLVFGVLGHVPVVGESIDAHGLRILVERADGRRVQVVRVSASDEIDEGGDNV